MPGLVAKTYAAHIWCACLHTISQIPKPSDLIEGRRRLAQKKDNVGLQLLLHGRGVTLKTGNASKRASEGAGGSKAAVSRSTPSRAQPISQSAVAATIPNLPQGV